MSWAGVILLLGIAADPVAADTVVVCPQEFLATMQPWIDHRIQQGHRIALVSNRLPARQIRDQIRQLASAGHLRSIVLVGDAPAAGANDVVPLGTTPTHLADAKVNVKWGSEPQIATDNWYADLDDDLVPDVSIGRLTADNQAELALMIQKILSYEQQGSGPWCRRLSFVAGVGGFGPLTDSVLEMATKSPPVS
jgi:hypothetical protein